MATKIAERTKFVGETAKDIAKRVFRNENSALILVLAGLIGVFAVATKGNSLSLTNARNGLIHSELTVFSRKRWSLTQAKLGHWDAAFVFR